MTDWYLCSPTVEDYPKPGKPSHPADCTFKQFIPEDLLFRLWASFIAPVNTHLRSLCVLQPDPVSILHLILFSELEQK